MPFNCTHLSLGTRECISTGAAGAQTRRSLGHHLLHPLILRLLVLCAPAGFETQISPVCTCTRRSKFLTHSLLIEGIYPILKSIWEFRSLPLKGDLKVREVRDLSRDHVKILQRTYLLSMKARFKKRKHGETREELIINHYIYSY